MAVGLAMVNYNGSDVLRVALDSIYRAKVNTPFVVALVDNGSLYADYEAVKKSFQMFQMREGAAGRDMLIRAETNLGFCGGSNLAARKLLELEDIERICFLNTDVIVTDGWLDKLMESESEIVGPVTNANGNEQTVWIDYEVEKSFDAYPIVADYAAFRAEVYKGYEVPSHNVTGFCSLIKRETLESVGFFDEQFFPGGYDDCDYNLRVEQGGGVISIRRDCYVHHFGGGSFSKLDMDTRIGISLANMIRFEEKWSTTWTGTQQFLPLSIAQDYQYLVENQRDDARALQLLQAASNAISSLLKNYEGRSIKEARKKYASEIASCKDMNLEVEKKYVKDEKAARAVESKMTKGVSIVRWKPYPDPTISTIVHSGTQFTKNVYHAIRAPRRRKETFQIVFDFIQNGRKYHRGTIAVLCGFYRTTNLRDGYWQRVYSVDKYVLGDYAKLYFENDTSSRPYIEVVDDQHMVFHCKLSNMQYYNIVKMLMRECGIVYVHSLLRCISTYIPSRLLNWLTKDHVVFCCDMHGSVPEEAILNDNWRTAQTYNAIEEVIMHGANILISVNGAMRNHFLKKYSYLDIKARLIVMPIFLNSSAEDDVINHKLELSNYKKPVVVYAGGIQKWQNIELMQDAIKSSPTDCIYDMMVPSPSDFLELYGTRTKQEMMQVHSVSPDEVLEHLRIAHFGFILRDDITVNHVACPTKLIEYLCYGVLPIVKTPNIGDFSRYGMRYITVEDFQNGNLPTEEVYMEMIRANRRVIEHMHQDYLSGRQDLRNILAK